MVFKGFFIELTFSGWFKYYSDKEGRFLKFDDLQECKNHISINEVF